MYRCSHKYCDVYYDDVDDGRRSIMIYISFIIRTSNPIDLGQSQTLNDAMIQTFLDVMYIVIK